MIGKPFFYLALFLLTFDGFPYYKFGLGSTKALSILPLLVVLFLNLYKIVKRRYKAREIAEILLISILLGVSYFQGKYVYYDMSEFSASISMFAVYFITIFVFKVFFDFADKKEITFLLKCIYRSFDISLIYGILELIYFYVIDSDSLYNILNFFMRDGLYLAGKRLQFNFSEPGCVGVMIVCIYIPTLYMLKKFGYRFSKFEKVKIIILFILTLFTKSVTYYSMIILLLILLFFYNSKSTTKKIMVSILGIFLFVGGYVVINSDTFISYSRTSSSRFVKILADPNYVNEDTSGQVRVTLWKLALYGWRDKPTLGYGWGYFKYALRANYDKLDSKAAGNPEMEKKLSLDNQQTYSIYSTCLVEGGILGVVWLILVLWPCIKNSKGTLKVFFILLLVSFTQIIFIYNVSAVVILQIYSSKKVTYFIERKLNNNEKGYMLSQ